MSSFLQNQENVSALSEHYSLLKILLQYLPYQELLLHQRGTKYPNGYIQCVLSYISDAWMIFVVIGYRFQRMIINSGFRRKRHFGMLKTTRTFNNVYIMLIKMFSKYPIISGHLFTIQENDVIIFKTSFICWERLHSIPKLLVCRNSFISYLGKMLCDRLSSERNTPISLFLQDISFSLVRFLKYLFLSLLLV